IQFCQTVAKAALEAKTAEIEKLLAAQFEGQSIESLRQSLIARLGENVQIRRVNYHEAKDKERLGHYVHLSRIGAVVVVEGGNDELAKDLAMQVASMRPQYRMPEDVPHAVVEKEKSILVERAKQSGKPESIWEQLNKYLNEICLTGQPFFKDPDKTI